MSHLLQILIPYLLLYKYGFLFLITLIAALIIPFPPGTLLIACAALASRGYFSLAEVIIVSILGNVAGDNICFWLARTYGKKVLRKIGFGKILDSKKSHAIGEHVRTHCGKLIFFTRFEAFSKLAVNIMTGLGKVPYKEYLVYEVAGEIVQISLYCSLGYFFGDNWDVIIQQFGVHILVLIALVILLCVLIFRKKKPSLTA